MSASKLLARSRPLVHPSCLKFTTPILVSAFSSKGFPPLRDGKPWVSRGLEMTAEWLTETMLISAYDIHYGHIPAPTALPCTPELTFVDSGGYEAGTTTICPRSPYGSTNRSPGRLSTSKAVLDTLSLTRFRGHQDYVAFLDPQDCRSKSTGLRSRLCECLLCEL
jgi:hypothetical protein